MEKSFDLKPSEFKEKTYVIFLKEKEHKTFHASLSRKRKLGNKRFRTRSRLRPREYIQYWPFAIALGYHQNLKCLFTTFS
jgi:hypothetical protein